MTGWASVAPSLSMAVACQGTEHTVWWSHGVIVLDDHGDRDAEEALVAFGGEEPACLAVARLWDDAVADGGFLGEWAEGNFDRARRWWLTMALERMRSEGFHEFLRDLPLARARRMGEFLSTFDDRWIDRAAAVVAASVDVPPSRPAVGPTPLTCSRAAAWVDVAVARRLRRAFVTAVGGRHLPLGAAALVPVTITIDPRDPQVEGRIDGRASWARISVGRHWLYDVWATGSAVLDGELTLAVDHTSGDRVSLTWADGTATLVGRTTVSRRTDQLGSGPG